MQFLTLALALATAATASPILRRDQYPSIAAVDQELNRVVLIPGTASDLSKRDQYPSIAAVDEGLNRVVLIPGTASDLTSRRRDLGVPVVDTTLNRVLEHEGATAPALRVRDQYPSIATVDQELGRVVLVPGSAADLSKRDDLALPVVDLEQNRVVEQVGGTISRAKRAAAGIVPVVVDEGHIVAMPMTAEDIAV